MVEHFSTLLTSRINSLTEDDVEQRHVEEDQDVEPPDKDELAVVIEKLKNHKAPGRDVCALPIAVSNTSDAAPCVVLGITYLHSQQISREDPCDFCLCLDGEVFCWWQQQCINNTLQHRTTPSSENNSTTVENEDWIEGDSNQNSTEVSTTTDTTCRVMGVEYKLGEVLPRETGTCLQCQCGKGARVTCSPKDCASPDQFRALEQQSLDMFDVDVF